MGGNRFFIRVSGNSMQEAYKTACEQAEDEYGHQQGYSGEINSTGGFRDLTKEFKASKHAKVNTFMCDLEKEDKLTKGNAYGVCTREPVVNTNKIKTVVNNTPFKGTRLWKLQYTVYGLNGRKGSFDFKDAAVKKAREISEQMKKPTAVVIERVSVQDKTVATIEYKPATNEAPGLYIFFGIASC